MSVGRKSAFAQFLDEVALYDPDNEERERAETGTTPGGAQMVAASSLWTIQEEEEPEIENKSADEENEDLP